MPSSTMEVLVVATISLGADASRVKTFPGVLLSGERASFAHDTISIHGRAAKRKIFCFIICVFNYSQLKS